MFVPAQFGFSQLKRGATLERQNRLKISRAKLFGCLLFLFAHSKQSVIVEIDHSSSQSRS